jgi:hypothetical protein
MSERDEFSLDDDFSADNEEDLDKFIVVGDRKKPKPGWTSPQAAWSRLEDVLAERRLARELKDDYDVEEA